MSEKIVKVTNGKVLNYKISASGYKTVYGSKVVTANSTINHTLVPESSQNGVYSLGDRIGNMASFVGYFNSINPDDNSSQKYAVFVLDAAYRKRENRWGNNSKFSGDDVTLPQYANGTAALAATESAEYNENLMYSKFTIDQLSDSAFAFCRSKSVVLDEVTYYAHLPNIAELKMIYDNRSQLDSFDPTASSYSSVSFSTWDFANSVIWSSTWSNSGYQAWSYQNYNSNPYTMAYYSTGGIVPVFEIPVE